MGRAPGRPRRGQRRRRVAGRRRRRRGQRDASVTPVVTGEVNPAALEDLVRLCVELDRLRAPPSAPRPRRPRHRAAPRRHQRRPVRRPARPARTPRGPGRLWSRRSLAKPRFFYCTLDRRLTCGDIHDESTASLPPVKAERRAGVASFGTRLSLPLAVFPEAPSASPWAWVVAGEALEDGDLAGQPVACHWRQRRDGADLDAAQLPAVPGRSPEAVSELDGWWSLDDPAGYHEMCRWPVILDDGVRAPRALIRAAEIA